MPERKKGQCPREKMKTSDKGSNRPAPMYLANKS